MTKKQNPDYSAYEFRAKSGDAYGIRVIVGELHVSATDDDVRETVKGKLTKCWDKLPSDARSAILAFAIRVHKANRSQYSRIMRGSR